MADWLATIVAGIGGALLVYLLGVPLRRRREERAMLAERRKTRAEKRARERFEREREHAEEREAEDQDYREFLHEVYGHFDAGGRVFPVERDDQDLGMRAVEEELFDDEWRSGKLILHRRRQ